jgi:proline dehydrogenase
VNFAAITLCVASQGVFVIDSVRKLLDTPSYNRRTFFLFNFCQGVPPRTDLERTETFTVTKFCINTP